MKYGVVAALLSTMVIALGCRSEAPTEAAPEGKRPAARSEIELAPEAITAGGIVVAKVERRAFVSGASVPAEVQFDPSSTAHVAPLVPGRITRVHVGLGDKVRAGQVLGVIASTDVSSARAQLGQAKARLSAAEATLKRQEQLASEGIGAQRALIDAEAQVGQLRAEVEGLSRQLSVFGSGSAGELALVAPINGVVVALDATLGETARPEVPAFVVTDPTKVWVRGNVPELEIGRVQPGGGARVRLHAFPDAAMPGKVTYVAPALDDRSRSLPIRVTLDVPDPRLRGGLFGSIELLESADSGVLVVPSDAVATIDGTTYVFLALEKPGTFTPAPVTLGRLSGSHFEVKFGLNEGQLIASHGAFTLKGVLRSHELADGE